MHIASVAGRGMLVAFCVVGGLATSVVAAQADQPWKVHGKLLGKAISPSDYEKSEDVSGIACSTTAGFPRLCLVADDETQGTQIVIMKDGELVAGDFLKLTDAQHAGKPLELDAEGVAFGGNSFYVTGSHGRPRHEDDPSKEEKNNAKAKATRQIFRITLPPSAIDMLSGKLVGAPEIARSVQLAEIIRAQPEISKWYDKALDDNGLTIEGVAVRDTTLYVGMRGPVLENGSAVILSTPLAVIFDGQQAQAKVHPLPLEKDTLGKPRGIRDLASYGSGFLLLAGPVNDPAPGHEIQTGDYSIYSWDGDATVKKLVDLKGYGKKVKPEALLPLDGNQERARILLMFDGPKEGSPTPLDLDLR
jgi:hypothetical protein